VPEVSRPQIQENGTQSIKTGETNMFRYIIGGLAAISIFSSTLCTAAVKVTPQLTQELMLKSGVKKQVEQLPALVLYGMDQAIQNSQQSLPPGIYENLKLAVLSSFRAGPILNKVQLNIENNLNKYDVEAILQWLKSPLGEKITKLEESAATPSAYEAMESMKEKLLQDTARVKRTRKLDEAIKGSESLLSLAVNTQKAIATSIASELAPDDPGLFEQIVEGTMAGRKQLESVIKDNTLVSLLSTYRALKDDEIDKYIDFASSDLGRRYHKTIIDGINSGFLSASRNVGKLFVQALR
jgi:hypothetical protein